jgi:hypothetical protein
MDPRHAGLNCSGINRQHRGALQSPWLSNSTWEWQKRPFHEPVAFAAIHWREEVKEGNVDLQSVGRDSTVACGLLKGMWSKIRSQPA